MSDEKNQNSQQQQNQQPATNPRTRKNALIGEERRKHEEDARKIWDEIKNSNEENQQNQSR